MTDWTEPRLWTPAVAAVTASAYYVHREGWTLTHSHRRELDTWAKSPPAEWYTHLNSGELLDVWTADLVRLLGL